MQAVLRQGKSSLYSYTRTSETRTVEDDDPDTEDVVETRGASASVMPSPRISLTAKAISLVF